MGTRLSSFVLRLPDGTHVWAVYLGLSLVDAGREVYADAAGQRADGVVWQTRRNLADVGPRVVHSSLVGRSWTPGPRRNEA